MMGLKGMMGCQEAMARLWEFIDGEMPAEERRALERHLEVCGRCYPAFDFQKAYAEYARRLATAETAPPELRRQLFARLLQSERVGDDEAGS